MDPSCSSGSVLVAYTSKQNPSRSLSRCLLKPLKGTDDNDDEDDDDGDADDDEDDHKIMMMMVMTIMMILNPPHINMVGLWDNRVVNTERKM